VLLTPTFMFVVSAVFFWANTGLHSIVIAMHIDNNRIEKMYLKESKSSVF